MRNKFKITWLIAILTGFLLIIVACGTNNKQLTIYTINDFHGALTEEDGSYGWARLAKFIGDGNRSNVLTLSAGDMFIGTAISGIDYGRTVIEEMNHSGVAAMAIGNHEFDWGIETILAYRDGDPSNGEADFPFLAVNIINKTTGELLPNVEKYTVVEKCGLKVGIIGYIGYGLEKDIATKMVKDYQFLNPVNEVGNAAEELRTVHNVDMVIALGHDGSSTTNTGLVGLKGDKRVDAIINGHEHLNVHKVQRTSDDRYIPIIQAGSSGRYVGELTFEVKDGVFDFTNGRTVEMTGDLPVDKASKKRIEQKVGQSQDILERVIGTAGKNIYRTDVQMWTTDCIREVYNGDVAVINMGGIRADAFPINKGQNITVSNVYRMAPFENQIVICQLTGLQLTDLFVVTGLAYSSNCNITGSSGFINGVPIEKDAIYRVVTIDYLYDNPSYSFQRGTNFEETNEVLRDVMIKAVENLTKQGKGWFE